MFGGECHFLFAVLAVALYHADGIKIGLLGVPEGYIGKVEGGCHSGSVCKVVKYGLLGDLPAIRIRHFHHVFLYAFVVATVVDVELHFKVCLAVVFGEPGGDDVVAHRRFGHVVEVNIAVYAAHAEHVLTLQI